MRRILLAVLILGCAALVAGLAAGQQQAPKQMTLEVSIIATANNAPVEDLKLEDITVKDNNKKQAIISFEKIVAGAPVTPGKPGLYNVVVLDCLNLHQLHGVPPDHEPERQWTRNLAQGWKGYPGAYLSAKYSAP